MDLRLRPDFPGQGKHARIGNNQGIRPLGPHIPKFGKVLFRPLQIPVVGQNIGRHINLDPMCMGKGNPLRHLLRREIFGLGPQTESLSSYIYRIRTKNHCRPQHLQAGGRDQQLRFITFHTNSHSPTSQGTQSVS